MSSTIYFVDEGSAPIDVETMDNLVKMSDWSILLRTEKTLLRQRMREYFPTKLDSDVVVATDTGVNFQLDRILKVDIDGVSFRKFYFKFIQGDIRECRKVLAEIAGYLITGKYIETERYN